MKQQEKKLKNLDEIAYVRYAAVYRKFKDITSFMEFMNEFEEFTKANDIKKK